MPRFTSRAAGVFVPVATASTWRNPIMRVGHRFQTHVSVFGLVLLAAGCGSRDEDRSDVDLEKVTALTNAQVQAARQAGLLPSTYLTPELIPGTGLLLDSQAYGINSGGNVVGFFHSGGPAYINGQPAAPFRNPADANGGPALPVQGTGPAYAIGLNDAGYVAG